VQGIATAIEKRRLEDDEAGSITETRSGGPHPGELNLEEVFRKLDEEWAEQQRREEERLEQQRHQESDE